MSDSVALVTGASQGIGQATAVRLARDFGAVALVARDRTNLEQTAAMVQNASATPLVIDADLSKEPSAQAVVDQTVSRFGRIDAPSWMSTLMLYGTKEGWEALEKKNLSLDEHRTLAARLAGTVQQIHAFWLEQRRKQIAEGALSEVVRPAPIRNPNKVGRNQSCPCGSGKKFKQCHGAADRLH